jgi:hypothetical protein
LFKNKDSDGKILEDSKSKKLNNDKINLPKLKNPKSNNKFTI